MFDEINRKQVKDLTKTRLETAGKNIKKLRTSGKLSQLDVSFYTYTEKSFISNLENGKVANVNLLTLLKLSELFNITLEELLRDD